MTDEPKPQIVTIEPVTEGSSVDPDPEPEPEVEPDG